MGTVMILCNSSGGLYDFRNEVVLALLKEHKVIVCAPDEVKTKQLTEEGCEVIHTPINRRGMNPVQDLSLFKQYRKILKEYRPNVVLTYTIKPNIYGGFACRLAKIPYITNITGLGSAFEIGGVLQMLVTTMYRVALKKAHCVFFQNVHNKGVLDKAKIHGKKARLVPGSGVNLEKYTYEPYPEGDEIEFLVMARIMKEKGIDEYIACAEKYHSDKVHFGIIGYYDEEEYREKIEALQARGVIKHYGFQTEVREYLKKASCAMVLSYNEGLSNVILESAATGRPAIASRIHGCIEAIDEGVTGLMFEVKNADSAVEAVGKFLELSWEEREAMGRAARAKVEREFDRKIVVNAYLEEIGECL